MFKTSFDRSPLVITLRLILLLLALLLILAPLVAAFFLLGDRRPVLPGPPHQRIEPRATPIPPVLGSIPLFDGKVNSLSFYGVAPDEQLEQSQTGYRFSKNEIARIVWVISIGRPQAEIAYPYKIEYHIFRNGEVYIDMTTVDTVMQEGWYGVDLPVGFGWEDVGHLAVGHYYLEVFNEGNLIANGAFEIYE